MTFDLTNLYDSQTLPPKRWLRFQLIGLIGRFFIPILMLIVLLSVVIPLTHLSISDDFKIQEQFMIVSVYVVLIQVVSVSGGYIWTLLPSKPYKTPEGLLIFSVFLKVMYGLQILGSALFLIVAYEGYVEAVAYRDKGPQQMGPPNQGTFVLGLFLFVITMIITPAALMLLEMGYELFSIKVLKWQKLMRVTSLLNAIQAFILFLIPVLAIFGSSNDDPESAFHLVLFLWGMILLAQTIALIMKFARLLKLYLNHDAFAGQLTAEMHAKNTWASSHATNTWASGHDPTEHPQRFSS